MLIAILLVLSLAFPYLLPTPRIEVPQRIIATVLPRPGQLDRTRAGLGQDISGGFLTVEPFGNWIAIRVNNVLAFPSGEARVLPGCIGLLRRIADVVEPEEGPIHILGHTDEQPIRPGGTFWDDQALSLARAEAVAALMRPALSDPSRIAVAGRGSDEPVTENAILTGRAHNRRVEILVSRHP
jgi:type VI secretion system protein ImpK